jgi:ParB family chromosome partitioning protein
MGKLDRLRTEDGGRVLESARGSGGELAPGIDPAAAVRKPARLDGVTRDRDAVRIPVARIERDPAQPREEFEEEALGRLAESLRTRGQLQAIRVRWDEGRGCYVILCGERRWRAAKMVGLADLACVIQEGEMSDEERLSLQLVENALREDLRPVEQARAYRALLERTGCSARDLARELCVSSGTITKALALLGLPEEVQALVNAGDLPASTAYEISRAEPELVDSLVDRVVLGGMTQERVAREVRRAKPARRGQGRARKVTHQHFTTPFGAVVSVDWSKGLDAETVVRELQEALEGLQRSA